MRKSKLVVVSLACALMFSSINVFAAEEENTGISIMDEGYSLVKR